MNRTAAILGALAVAAAIYFGSPVLGFYRLQDAARSGDRDALDASVDFSALRDDMKGQLHADIAARIQKGRSKKHNDLSDFGLMLADAVVGKLVDSLLTPQAVSTMIANGTLPSPGRTGTGGSGKLEKHYAYVSLDLFRVTIRDPTHPDMPLSFILERRNLIGWKLVRIQLPPKLFG